MALNHKIIAVSWLGLSTTLMILILLSMLYRMYCEHTLIKSQNKVIKFYRGAYIGCITSSIICTAIDCIHGYVAYSEDVTMLNEHSKIYLKLSADLWYFIASNLLNIILFGRVYLTFVDTIYALSNIKVTFFTCLMSIAIVGCFVYCSFFIIFPGDQTKQDKYGFYPSLVVMISDFIISLFLLYLFNSKLRQLIAKSVNLDTHHPTISYSAPNTPTKNDKITANTQTNCSFTQTPQRHYIQNIQHIVISIKTKPQPQVSASVLQQSIAQQAERTQSVSASTCSNSVCSPQYQSITSNTPNTPNCNLVIDTEHDWNCLDEDSPTKPIQPIAIQHNGNGNGICNQVVKNKDDDSLRSASLLTDSVIFGRRRTESGYIKPNKCSFANHHIKLIKVMTRQSVLSGFAILFNQFFFIADCISLNEYFEKNVYLSQSIYVERSIGLLGIVVCLYLSTKFNKDTYQTICSLCHNWCYKCCVYFTRQTIANSTTDRKTNTNIIFHNFSTVDNVVRCKN